MAKKRTITPAPESGKSNPKSKAKSKAKASKPKSKPKASKEPTKPIAVSKRRRRRARATPRANPSPNPPMLVDLTNVLLPGFGAYTATRALSRIVYALVSRRSERWSKHAHAAAGLVTFAGAWFLGHRWEKIAPYHDGILIGSGIAAMQGVVQTYLPEKYRWVLADPQASDYSGARIIPPAPASAANDTMHTMADSDDDDILRDYDERIDRMQEQATRRRANAAPRAAARPLAPPENEGDDPDALLSDLDLDADEDFGSLGRN